MAKTPLLVSVDNVRSRMGLDESIEGSQELIESAIRTAQVRIQSEYDSNFQLETRKDLFYLDPDAYSGVRPGGLFHLCLKNAFVLETPPLTIQWGWDWRTLETANVEDYLLIDREKGWVFLDDHHYQGRFISVSYKSGFSNKDEVPDWIAEAILGYVPVVFNFAQVTNRNAEAEAGYKTSGDNAMAMLVRNRRNTGFGIRPLN